METARFYERLFILIALPWVNVASFSVFHTEATVSIDLKNVLRMVTQSKSKTVISRSMCDKSDCIH